jgi:hypothetical protein
MPWLLRIRSGTRTFEAKVDINYLFLRQQMERSRAATATSNIARGIHEQLAAQYERLIEQATDGRVTFAPVAPTRRHAANE